MRNKSQFQGTKWKIPVILFWLAVWYLAAGVVDNKVLLADPFQTLERLLECLREASFYRILWRSLLRIQGGFFGGLLTGILLAVFSARYFVGEFLLSPVMHLLQTVPVASFAVILLIRWGSGGLAVAVCFMVVLPVIYTNMLEGLKHVDPQLRELAELYRFPFRTRLFYLYMDAIKPYLYAGLKVSLGMCWKSGVAAEVIGIPDGSLGEQLYLSKVYLDTAGVFAWTGVVIILSMAFEKLVMLLAEKIFLWKPACPAPGRRGTEQRKSKLLIKDLTAGYGEHIVWEHLSRNYEAGKIYFLREPSGSGKTTLLAVMAGLIKPVNGQLEGFDHSILMFQEDRLFESYSPLKNLEMVTGDEEKARQSLLTLLPEECLTRTCHELSGGMKRRVALARAMEAESSVVLLDEPFTGLDKEMRACVMRYIEERQQGRTVLIATHIEV